MTAIAVAAVVLVNAKPAVSVAESAEPALKPYHPNHSRLAPNRIHGTLCGRAESRGQPRRLPRTRHSASAAAPALIWTAVPPAKSSALSLLAIHPPEAGPPDTALA